VAIPLAVFSIVFPQWQAARERAHDAATACQIRNSGQRSAFERDDALLEGVLVFTGNSENGQRLVETIRAQWELADTPYRDCNHDETVGDDGDFLP
jgi:hypothetical protein